MPSCEPCGAYYTPNSLPPDGTCPSCGRPVEVGEHATASEQVERDVPWHFWVGVAAVTLYLGWRVVQGLVLLF